MGSNVLNGHPVIRFVMNNSNYLLVNDHASLKPTESISFFVVGMFKPTSSDYSPFIVKTNDWEWQKGYGLARYIGDDELTTYAAKYKEKKDKVAIPYTPGNYFISSSIYQTNGQNK